MPNLTTSEKLDNCVDRIIGLSHRILNQIKQQQIDENEELSSNSKLCVQTEKMYARRLTEACAEYRELLKQLLANKADASSMRFALEFDISRGSGLIPNTSYIGENEEFWRDYIKNIMLDERAVYTESANQRIQNVFETFGLIIGEEQLEDDIDTMDDEKSLESVLADNTILDGTYEYNTIKNIIEQQNMILDIEETYLKGDKKELSPVVVSNVIAAIAEARKYRKAEKMLAGAVNVIEKELQKTGLDRQQKKDLMEIKDLFLDSKVWKRYSTIIAEATGLMNSKTAIAKEFAYKGFDADDEDESMKEDEKEDERVFSELAIRSAYSYDFLVLIFKDKISQYLRNQEMAIRNVHQTCYSSEERSVLHEEVNNSSDATIESPPSPQCKEENSKNVRQVNDGGSYGDEDTNFII